MSASRIGLAVVAVAAIVVAIVFAALYFTNGSDGEAAADQCENSSFGHIAALERDGDTYGMRLDPPGSRAASWRTKPLPRTVVKPANRFRTTTSVSRRGLVFLTYLVPADADVTVLTNNGTGILSTSITVSELAGLVAGKTPLELFEPLETGVWIRYHVDTVCTIDQQYLP